MSKVTGKLPTHRRRRVSISCRRSRQDYGFV